MVPGKRVKRRMISIRRATGPTAGRRERMTLLAVERLAIDLWRLKVFRVRPDGVDLISTVEAPFPALHELAAAAVEQWAAVDELRADDSP